MGAISNVVTSEAFNDGIIMKQSCEGGKGMKEYMSLQGKIPEFKLQNGPKAVQLKYFLVQL